MSSKIMKKLFVIFVLVIWAVSILLYYKMRFTLDEQVNVELNFLKSKIIEFKAKCGNFPSRVNSLNSLVDPSLEKCNTPQLIPIVPKDPWDGDYKYIIDSSYALLLDSRDNGRFVLIR